MANIKYTSLIILVALLIGTSAWAVSAWTSDIPMSNWVALGFGGVFTLAVGCGLIALLFFSSRRGYDEHAIRTGAARSRHSSKSNQSSLRTLSIETSPARVL